ncbi:MAG: hypothetical protein WBG17_13875 [Burkholderiaceae bacterium]
MMKRILAVAVLAVLFGCGQKANPEPEVVAEPAKVEEPAPPPVPAATPEEWKAALLATYKEDNVEDKGDGITGFTACFALKEDGKCKTLSLASRDAFRKLRFYKSGWLSATGNGCPYVNSYVSVPDNDVPVLFLNPCYFSKDGWLFMEKVAIMVDGEVVLERNFDDHGVKRDAESYGVQEDYHFVATDADLQALRKISPASKVLVRLTGKKGYVSVKPKDAEEFKKEIINALYIFDTIKSAVSGHLPPA